MISKSTEQRIKDSADIVDVMQDFIVLKRKGSRYTCLCPFHDDKHLGSFSIYPRLNGYKCFSCDASGGPIDFLMDYKQLSYPDALRYLATKYNIPIEETYDKEKFRNIKPSKPRQMNEQLNNLPKRFWPVEYISYYTNVENDNLVCWLRSLNWDGCQRKRLEDALVDYHVGHTYIMWKGERYEFTLWWELDEENRLHNCHYMTYGKDGHRDKKSSYNQTWLHARMKYSTKDPFDDNKEQASYCLFGQHLMNAWPNATINIVESEKTAIIMAAAYGNNASTIWMACCGLHNLTSERLEPLMKAGRQIQLFPDRDGIEKWKKKAVELSYNGKHYPYLGFNTQAVEEWWLPEDGDKADIGDVVLRFLND